MSTRLHVERLESRCLLSLAPAADYFVPADILPSAPAYGREPSPIIGLPPPRDPYNWPPSVPESSPPPDPLPDWSDQGGPIDLGGFTQPPVVVKDVKDSDEAKEVLALLAALTFVPASETSAPTIAADALAAALDPAVTRAIQPQPEQGGLVAVARSPLPETEPADAALADLDAWLEAPVRMEGNRGRFQAFEISTTERARPRPVEFNAGELPASLPEIHLEEPGLAIPTSPHEAGSPEAVPTEKLPAEQPAPEAAAQLAAPPLPVDQKTGWRLSAAAVAFLFAWLLRTTRPATDDDRLAVQEELATIQRTEKLPT